MYGAVHLQRNARISVRPSNTEYTFESIDAPDVNPQRPR